MNRFDLGEARRARNIAEMLRAAREWRAAPCPTEAAARADLDILLSPSGGNPSR